MITLTVPDLIDTRNAISGAEECIERARGCDLFDYYGLREQQKRSDEMVAYVVRSGGDLASARYWAMRSALIRDARSTAAERSAAREAVAS